MGRKIKDEAEARRCLRIAATSGMSRRDWARSQGLDARSLNAWRLSLERRDAKAVDGSSIRVVELVTESVSHEHRPDILLTIGSIKVTVPKGFDERELTKVVRAVHAAC